MSDPVATVAGSDQDRETINMAIKKPKTGGGWLTAKPAGRNGTWSYVQLNKMPRAQLNRVLVDELDYEMDGEDGVSNEEAFSNADLISFYLEEVGTADDAQTYESEDAEDDDEELRNVSYEVGTANGAVGRDLENAAQMSTYTGPTNLESMNPDLAMVLEAISSGHFDADDGIRHIALACRERHFALGGAPAPGQTPNGSPRGKVNVYRAPIPGTRRTAEIDVDADHILTVDQLARVSLIQNNPPTPVRVHSTVVGGGEVWANNAVYRKQELIGKYFVVPLDWEAPKYGRGLVAQITGVGSKRIAFKVCQPRPGKDRNDPILHTEWNARFEDCKFLGAYPTY